MFIVHYLARYLAIRFIGTAYAASARFEVVVGSLVEACLLGQRGIFVVYLTYGVRRRGTTRYMAAGDMSAVRGARRAFMPCSCQCKAGRNGLASATF